MKKMYPICRGICGQPVPEHILPENCKMCIRKEKTGVAFVKTPGTVSTKICSGICGMRVSKDVTPETCVQCSKWKMCGGICGGHKIPAKSRCRFCAKLIKCSGVCGKIMKKDDYYDVIWTEKYAGCRHCYDIKYPIGTCSNGCAGVRLFNGYCELCKKRNNTTQFISVNGGVLDGFSVVIVRTRTRRAKYCGTRIPFKNVNILRFPCLYSAYVNKKKLNVYSSARIKETCSNDTDDDSDDDLDDDFFSNDSEDYKYVISNSLYDKIVKMKKFTKIANVLNSYSDYIPADSDDSDDSVNSDDSDDSDDSDISHEKMTHRKKVQNIGVSTIRTLDVIWTDSKKICIGDMTVVKDYRDISLDMLCN